MKFKKPYRIAASAILFIAVVMFIIFSYTHYNLRSNPISGGYLDLSQSSLEDTVYSLDGNWIFLPDVFADPAESISDKEGTSAIKVPGAMYQLKSSGKNVKAGTYELKIRVPSPGRYALKATIVSGAYRLYSNGELIGEVGTVGADSESEKSVWQPVVYLLDTASCDITLTFHVSNYHCVQGGLVQSLYFGTIENVYYFQSMQAVKGAVIIGILVGIGIYLLLLTGKSNHRKTGISLSIFCLTSALLESLLDENIFFYFFRNLPLIIPMKVQWAAYAVLITCVFYFFKYIDPPKKPNPMMAGLEIINLTYLILIILAYSYNTVTFVGDLCVFILGINAVIHICRIIQAIRAKKRYAYISLMSLVVLATLSYLQFNFFSTGRSLYLYTRENLFIIGILFFILCQINILLTDVDRAYENAKQAAAMEIAYLQAQISPHFMFNTLNNVSYLMTDDVPKAQTLLQQFCNFLRTKYKFDFRNTIEYTLGEELDFLESYVYIENIRFQNMLTLIVNAAESLRSMKLMPLILQPLVENAIKHGYDSKPLTVEISVDELPDSYLFKVKDNGKGMLPMKLKDIDRSESSGIGVANINYRLEKLCGEKLHFESAPDEGTTVSFKYVKEASPV